MLNESGYSFNHCLKLVMFYSPSAARRSPVLKDVTLNSIHSRFVLRLIRFANCAALRRRNFWIQDVAYFCLCRGMGPGAHNIEVRVKDLSTNFATKCDMLQNSLRIYCEKLCERVSVLFRFFFAYLIYLCAMFGVPFTIDKLVM